MSEFAFVIQTLHLVEKVYGDLLAEDAHSVMEEAAAKLQASHEAYRKNPTKTWGYSIDHQQPLRFVESERPIKAFVDLYCDVQWQEDVLPVTQDLKIRVWSKDRKLIFRDSLDAEYVGLRLDDPEKSRVGERVISRFHFDKANHNQGKGIEYHPTYHIQVGGISEEYELCWHPKSFDIPRFPYQPMDIFLACQLIATNFFPTVYSSSIRTGDWKSRTKSCEKKYLEAYYLSCLKYVRGENSLLDELAPT